MILVMRAGPKWAVAAFKRAPFLLAAALTCDPELTRLFTPLHPQVGRYEVCVDPRPIEVLAKPSGPDRLEAPHYGPIEEVEALDAFGRAGPYDRSALARLYGGRRARVAHGWKREGDRFESITLISPYPDASLVRLEPGTMIIRLTIRN